MHDFVFAIHKLFAMLFLFTDNSLNDFPGVPIKISNAFASSCFMYYNVSCDRSSIPAKLCNAKFAIIIRSCMDESETWGMANP